MNIVLLGKPGAGKGMFAEFLQKHYGFTHISTGDLCRKNIRDNTIYGKIVEEHISKGQLVPLEIILDMLKSEIKKEASIGFILDGFPRNIIQAKELEKIVDVNAVLMIDVPDEIILERISNRRICPNCHKIYNLKDTNGKCLECGTVLVKRADDDLKIAKNRLQVYEKETKPLIEYFNKKIIVIDNSSQIDVAISKVKEIIDNLLKKTGENV